MDTLKRPTLENLSHSEVQDHEDGLTLLSEIVDGPIHTEYEFTPSPDGQDLLGKDGRGMVETAQKFLDIAETRADDNHNLDWLLRRTLLEKEEIDYAIEMGQGKGPNTLVVVSDFVPELKGAKEDFEGYNVKRQQTMLRLYLRKTDSNSVVMITKSLDRSDRRALEAIYAEFNLKPAGGELLGQRIVADLNPEQQAGLSDHLTSIYDRSMAEQYGGVWEAGRNDHEVRNTYEFVGSQHDIMATYMRLHSEGHLNATTLYDIAAYLQERFDEHKQPNVISIVPRMITYNPAVLDHAIRGAGVRARSSGKKFSSCGLTLTGENADESTEDQMRMAGIGSDSKESSAWHGGKIHRNEKCRSCNKKREKVGACYICEHCVDNPRSNKRTNTSEAAQEARQRREQTAKPLGRMMFAGTVKLVMNS